MRMETLLLNTNTEFLNKQAMVQLYEQYSPGIFRYAYRLLGDSHLAEDCVAETFSRLLKAVKHGQGPSDNAQAYLYRVAHNWITDHYRRQTLKNTAFDEEHHVSADGNPVDVYSEKQAQERLRDALMCLSPEQRQVIQLRFFENWPHEQVATTLGRSVEATRALQHRALSALRRMLLDEEGRYEPNE